ncbi:unnamed protein product [Acanthoscelides obtectus]|uniref:CHK kinase-like domain-containing protein n=1 Tax=Acanthoscelides obtectus TaxID=200917 RepID=A0A9P0PV01_ACAOB|nr:unnamed protein product [Acanthoscelides obtectus]CAK1621438.1 hypothetical protein AOBTE_LOCUS957 [Acanthoscelides obtectus]
MAEAPPEIEKIWDLLNQYIEKHKKIVKIIIGRLTQPGENYGSEIMKVDMVLKDENSGDEEELYLVAKMIPESDLYKEIFNVQVSFVSEMRFYDTVVPILEDFRKRKGAKVKDIYPKFYGGRKNLNIQGGAVDTNAVLLMDNIKIKGYENLDRHKGFDLKGAKVVLEAIAYFHVTPLALKLQEPGTFEEKIKPHLACFLPGRTPEKEQAIKERYRSFCHRSMSFVSECEECIPALPLVEKCIGKWEPMRRNNFREPFSTILHTDVWVNNIMVKNCQSDIDIKLVDFQFCTYDSPVEDLMFFLITSVPLDVLKNHLDELLQSYHKYFIQELENLKCSTDQFGYGKLLVEIKECLHNTVFRCLWFIPTVVLGEKGTKSDVTKIVPSQAAKEKIWWMVQEFYRRGWLD